MKNQPANPIVDKVLELVAEHYKTTLEDIKEGKEPKLARRVAVYLLKEEFGQTLRVIQDKLGIHSAPTLYADLKKIQDSLPKDRAVSLLIESVKTEVLMMGVTDAHSQPASPPKKAPPEKKSPASSAPGILPRAQAAPPSTLPKEKEIIEMVQIAVSEVCLGPTLLNSPNANEEVKVARHILIYLIWKDFKGGDVFPIQMLMDKFQLNEESFFTAIGSVTVRLDEPFGDFKQKLADIRTKYSSQMKK